MPWWFGDRKIVIWAANDRYGVNGQIITWRTNHLNQRQPRLVSMEYTNIHFERFELTSFIDDVVITRLTIFAMWSKNEDVNATIRSSNDNWQSSIDIQLRSSQQQQRHVGRSFTPQITQRTWLVKPVAFEAHGDHAWFRQNIKTPAWV